MFRKFITILMYHAAVCALGQDKPAFQVATIKPAAANAVKNQMMRVSPTRVSIPSMTLTWLVYTAYGEGLNTATRVTGGPSWVNETSYAVEGLADASSTDRQFRMMLRTLLEERFGLKIHTETQTGDVYALVLDRSDGRLGPKVRAWDGTCSEGRMPSVEDDPVTPRCTSWYQRPGIVMDGATMFSVAEILSLPQSRTLLGTIVQDRTGLTGRYKLELEYDFSARPLVGAAGEMTGPSLFTAIREQWGMKLEKAKGPLKVLAIDAAERPAEN